MSENTSEAVRETRRILAFGDSSAIPGDSGIEITADPAGVVDRQARFVR